MTRVIGQPAPVYDVVIVGGGVVGSITAYRLSGHGISVCLLEKEADLAAGATGANSAIVHAGYDPVPGTLKARYNVEGSRLFPSLCAELGVPFVRNGSLVLAFSEEEHRHLAGLLENGCRNGVEGLELLTADRARALEPALAGGIHSALLAPSGSIVCPYELTFASAETALRNGVDFFFEHEVTGIERPAPGGGFLLRCATRRGQGPERRITARLVVNAAGAFADRISAMAGDASFTITPRRGEYAILDKQYGRPVGHTVFQTPTERGKGVLVTPAVDGNMIIGPNAHAVADPDDTATTTGGMDEVWSSALRSVPSLDRSASIRTFAGIRATPSTHDFIVGESRETEGLFQAAGIESPGLTASPAISKALEEAVIGRLRRSGRAVGPRPGAVSGRVEPIRFRRLGLAEQAALLAADPRYANVICRCENITEPEIIDAIRRTLGEVTVNGIKMRTRAGMGRCQGGFCLPRVMGIIARETGMEESEITLSGTGSRILSGRTRDGGRAEP